VYSVFFGAAGPRFLRTQNSVELGPWRKGQGLSDSIALAFLFLVAFKGWTSAANPSVLAVANETGIALSIQADVEPAETFARSQVSLSRHALRNMPGGAARS
jgi:hypothetical protein